MNNNKEMRAANIYYYALDTLLSTLTLFTRQCLMVIIYTHFTDEKTEKRRGWVTGPVTELVKCRAGIQTLTAWHQSVLPTIVFFHLKGVKQSISSWTNICLAPATCQAVCEALETQNVLCKSPGWRWAGWEARWCISDVCAAAEGGGIGRPRFAHLLMAVAQVSSMRAQQWKRSLSCWEWLPKGTRVLVCVSMWTFVGFCLSSQWPLHSSSSCPAGPWSQSQDSRSALRNADSRIYYCCHPTNTWNSL